MKKLLNTALAYALAAMAGGVFFREFTKFHGFEGVTVLSTLHVHLFVLGMIFFLLAALWEKGGRLSAQKRFRLFYGLYNAGLIVTAGTLLVRGVLQVLEVPLDKGPDTALSGIAGLGHILLAAGIVAFFLVLRRAALKPHPAK